MEASCSHPVVQRAAHAGFTFRKKPKRCCSRRIRAEPTDKSKPQEALLRQAASAYSQGLEDGLNEDEMVAQTLGAKNAESLTTVQEAYKDKVKERLAQKAAELKKRNESQAGYQDYMAGQGAYERGQYAKAEALLVRALDASDSFSQFGGDIQIMLALAYNATGKEEECLELFKQLEKTHPVPAIRKQAGHLGFIMGAPKLQISEDEKVNIPVVTLDPNVGKKKGSVRRPSSVQTPPKVKKSMEDEFWENYKPPKYLRNRYVWAAGAIVSIALAVYSATYSQT